MPSPNAPKSTERPCDPVVQQQRQDMLDMAYLMDGRDKPDHPHHCTYTALNLTTSYDCIANANHHP
jgi:hypothetical protein